MTALREKLNDTSLFRILYVIDLFFCMISFVQILAYVLLVPLFVWGLRLVYLNQRRYETFARMRFGIWVGAFLICSLISILFNISYRNSRSSTSERRWLSPAWSLHPLLPALQHC